MTAIGHERRSALQRRQVRRLVRDAQRSGRRVARRNERLAADIDFGALPEQASAIIAAAAAHAAETPRDRSSSTAPRRSAKTVRAVLVAAVLVAATASTLSAGDIEQTHAWFTAQQVVTGNGMSSAVVKVAGVGPDLNPGAKLSVPNLLPLSDADAADATRGVFLDLTVRNTGSVPINWTLSLKDIKALAGSADLGAITNVSYSVSGGAWSTPQKLNVALSVTGQNLPSGTTGNTVPVRFRFWLDKTAGNESQGAVAAFTTDLQAIQTGAS